MDRPFAILFLIAAGIASVLAWRLLALRRSLTESRDNEHDRLFELSLDMMAVTTFEGAVKLINPQFSAATGWSTNDLMTDDFTEFVHPDDRQATRESMIRVSQGQPLTSFRNRIRCKDGSYKMLSWKATPDLGRRLVYAVARDVTDDDQLVRSFVENIDQVVWVTEVEGGDRVLYVSPAYEKIWGRPCASLYSNPHGWLEAIHVEDRARVEAAWAAQRITGDYREEYRIVRPDGAIRWIRDRGIAVRGASGGISRLAGLANDITEYKATAEALHHNDRLAAIGTLAAGIAHEINNPIGGIQLAALSALQADDPAHIERALTDIVREAQRCSRIVDNVLTFAREADSEKCPADLDDVVRRTVEGERLTLEGFGIDVEVSSAGGLPAVPLNETEVEQALVNLIHNAAEARAHKIRLHTERVNGMVRLTVEDDGLGMSAEQKAHVFEPFYTTRRGRGGTGLGLSIIHGIVEDHGGTIEVESERGLGTKMTLTFPIARNPEQEAARHGSSARS